MQAERLGIEIEVFLCAVGRHRQVVVAVDARHGHLLPEICLSPRHFGQRTRSRSRSSHTNYFLPVVTCLREKSDSISKLRPSRRALDRLRVTVPSRLSAKTLSTHAVVYNTFKRPAPSHRG